MVAYYFLTFQVLKALIFICCLLSFPAWSQESKGYFDHFGLGEGLSQATVHCTFQDSYGFLWVGTEDGLNRYDGYEFRVFQHDPSDSTTISNNVIYAIHEDSEGVLWIGTASGLNRYNRFTGEFTVYRYSSEKSHSISDNTITAVEDAGKDNLWVGTRNGLNLMNISRETFRVFRSSDSATDFSLSSNIINDLVTDQQNRLWCATGAGLNVFDPADSTFIVFSHIYGSENAIAHPIVHCLERDDWGRVWVGTQAGLSVVDSQLQVENILEPDIPDYGGFTDPVFSLESTDEHLIWVGSSTSLMCIDDQGRVLSQYANAVSIKEGLSGGSILSLLEDRGGSVWIGTFSRGLFRFSQQQQIFKHYELLESSQNGRDEVWTVYPLDDDRCLAGSNKGLLSTERGSDKLQKFAVKGMEGQLASPVKGIVSQGSRIFIGTSGQGLLAVDRQMRLRESYTVDAGNESSINSNRITCMLADSGGIWLGTVGGGLNFFEYATGKFSHWKFSGDRNKGLIDNHITSLTKDSSGTLWIGTANRGLSRMDVDSESFEHFEYNSELSNSLSSNQVRSLFMDRNNRLWIATEGGGLNIRHPDSTGFEVIRSLHGLPSNTVSAFTEDSTGIIWASTNSGLVRIDYERFDLRKFDMADGLQQLEFMPGAAGHLEENELWFGSTSGLVVVNVADYVPREYAPPVVFTEVITTHSKNGIQHENSFFPKQEEPVVLNHGVNTIRLQFAVLNLMQSDKNNYAYRVEPTMDTWINLGDRRNLTLTHLDPGEYRILVKGANPDGVWNENYSTLLLVIRPALWQTAWFKLGVIILLCVSIYLIYRWRLARVKAQNRMLERVVKDRTTEIAKERDEKAVLLKEIHHRVKNNLQIISSLLSLQSRFADDPKIENLFLESTNRVQSMSMIHEKMYRSENLKEINLQQYIRELVHALVEAYNVNRKVDVEIEVNVERFAVDTLTPLGLIINELVSNTLKYAFKGRDKGRIFLRLEKGDGADYHLFLGDDGIGFNEEDVREGAFGTELVEDLATQLKGSIERLDTDEGTTFHLVFENVDSH